MAIESYEKLITDLKKLRLPAMAEMLDSYTKQAVSSSMSYMDRNYASMKKRNKQAILYHLLGVSY